MDRVASRLNRRRTKWIAGLALTGLLVSAWAGCSYESLSYWFDGVPDPNDPRNAGLFPGSTSVKYFEHDPFTKEACLECHPNPSEMQLTLDDANTCYQCHEEVENQYEVMHGAVAAQACLWCHNPHLSPYPNLMRDATPELCLQCHRTGLLDSPILEDEDPITDCLQCHFGHGGPEANFLRPENEHEEYHIKAGESRVDPAG